MQLSVIARIENPYKTKFGVPRQSGIVDEVESRIVFEKEYRVAESLRGIEEFSHLWLIWGFDQAEKDGWSPTVRPPRLGGNVRMGVFATRSPYRPNKIGLSCVRLIGIEKDAEKGWILRVAGADLMNGTPIYDIKPYLPWDAHPEATGGFTDGTPKRKCEVFIPEAERQKLPEETAAVLEKVLAEDPRPAYQDDPEREYAFEFDRYRVRFRAADGKLNVTEIAVL